MKERPLGMRGLHLKLPLQVVDILMWGKQSENFVDHPASSWRRQLAENKILPNRRLVDDRWSGTVRRLFLHAISDIAVAKWLREGLRSRGF